MRHTIRRRVSRQLAPITSPLLTQSLAGIAIIGICGGWVASLFLPAVGPTVWIGIAAMIALFSICAAVSGDDFDTAQQARARARAYRSTQRAATELSSGSGSATPLPELLEA